MPFHRVRQIWSFWLTPIFFHQWIKWCSLSLYKITLYGLKTLIWQIWAETVFPIDFIWRFSQTFVDALPSSTPNLVVPRDINFFPPMDRVVQSESKQYNRVGSKDLNLGDMSRSSISHWFQLGILSYMSRCLTIEYAKFGLSEGHQFFSTNG